MLTQLARLPERRSAWACLSASALLLVASALYFQYAMGLEPCVKCIYQRFAVFAIGMVALIPLVAPQLWWTRLIGFAGWIIAAVWGYQIATGHVELQQSANSFFAVCDSFPNFPAFMPLHEWFPALFAAPGLCGDIDWELLGISMPGWMRIIFAGYGISAIALLSIRLLRRKRL